MLNSSELEQINTSGFFPLKILKHVWKNVQLDDCFYEVNSTQTNSQNIPQKLYVPFQSQQPKE